MMTTCAPNVAPATLEKVIQVESGGNPLALNVNIKWVTERDTRADRAGQRHASHLRTDANASTNAHPRTGRFLRKLPHGRGG